MPFNPFMYVCMCVGQYIFVDSIKLVELSKSIYFNGDRTKYLRQHIHGKNIKI